LGPFPRDDDEEDDDIRVGLHWCLMKQSCHTFQVIIFSLAVNPPEDLELILLLCN
jgi:hypothetical protein